MPSLSPKDLKLTDDLSKEYRIVFAGELQPEEWPEHHKLLLGQLAELGEKKFRSYAADCTGIDNPWKLEAKQLARNLVERAKRSNHRNESSWRYSCEPYIFARLSGEVVCRNCRKRVWRSEIEASCENTSPEGQALQNRQQAREPCRCHRMARNQDPTEAIGLNRIFGHREDETVRHDPTITERLPKKSQRPDAMFGLRRTRNLENLLNDTRKHQLWESGSQQLHEELIPSPVDQPLDQNGDELLYPFLVLEAKSGKSDCDWHSIQVQNAFPIRTFLETQYRLLRHSKTQHTRSAPLVWVFANRGEDWRVSVAFIVEDVERRNTVGDKDYMIIDVWRGSILTLDGALQLLLLVDYVFDWARDIYREEIIRTLKSLASGDNDNASRYADSSSILSARHVAQAELHSSTSEHEDYEAYLSAQRPIVAKDTTCIVIRHATFIESRFCCVFATRDNVRDLLRSTEASKTQIICCRVVENMRQALLVDQSALDAMEERWTGTTRVTPAQQVSEARFYTVASCTKYLSGSWHQVRELYVVAIAEDAWDVILQGSSLKPYPYWNLYPRSVFVRDNHLLLRAIDGLQAGTTEETLLACISRQAVELLAKCLPFGREKTPSEGSGARTAGSIEADKSVGVLRDIVHYMYTSLKKGSFEPQESFMRVSKRFDQQHLLSNNKDLHPLLSRVTYHYKKLSVSADGCVLIQSKCHAHDPERSPSNLCLYLVNGNPDLPTEREVADYAKRTFETRDMYHTTQDNGTSNISRKVLQRIPWNLLGIKGICCDLKVWENIVMELCRSNGPPIRHGMPLLSNGIGREGWNWSRNRPWRDERLGRNLPDVRMFLSYKLASREIEYWKKVATARLLEGARVCRWCAGDLPKALAKNEANVPFCKLCLDNHSSRALWISNYVCNRPPFIARSDWCPHANYALYDNYEVHDDAKYYLNRYSALEQPFNDMRELLLQAKAFQAWSLQERREKGGGTSAKRRRVEDSPESGRVKQERASPPRIDVDLTIDTNNSSDP